MTRRFKGYADEVIGWWANHIIDGGCAMCPSTTPPDTAAAVIAEWERRGKPRPRDVPQKRGTKK